MVLLLVGWVCMQQCTVRGPATSLAALQAAQEKLGLGGGLVALSSAALWFPLAVSEFICELACRVGTVWSQYFWIKQTTVHQGYYHNAVLITIVITTTTINRACNGYMFEPGGHCLVFFHISDSKFSATSSSMYDGSLNQSFLFRKWSYGHSRHYIIDQSYY